MSASPLEVMSGRAGSKVLNTTTAFTADVLMVVVLEDTIFNALTDDAGNDKADYIQDPAVAVKAGAVFTPIDPNKPFVNIDLTSGSVNVVLK